MWGVGGGGEVMGVDDFGTHSLQHPKGRNKIISITTLSYSVFQLKNISTLVISRYKNYCIDQIFQFSTPPKKKLNGSPLRVH